MELPEVEVMRRDLEKEVVGRRIKDADVRPKRNAMRVIRRHARRKEFSDGLAGKKITKVDRKGKYLLLHLDDGDVLVVHFGMSGQFLRGNKRQSLPQHLAHRASPCVLAAAGSRDGRLPRAPILATAGSSCPGRRSRAPTDRTPR